MDDFAPNQRGYNGRRRLSYPRVMPVGTCVGSIFSSSRTLAQAGWGILRGRRALIDREERLLPQLSRRMLCAPQVQHRKLNEERQG